MLENKGVQSFWAGNFLDNLDTSLKASAVIAREEAKTAIEAGLQQKNLNIVEDLAAYDDQQSKEIIQPFSTPNAAWNLAKRVVSAHFDDNSPTIEPWDALSPGDIMRSGQSERTINNRFLVKYEQQGSLQENPSKLTNCKVQIPDINMIVLPPNHRIKPSNHTDTAANRKANKTIVKHNEKSSEKLVATGIAETLKHANIDRRQDLFDKLHRMDADETLTVQPATNYKTNQGDSQGDLGLNLSGIGDGRQTGCDVHEEAQKITEGKILRGPNRDEHVQTRFTQKLFVMTHLSPTIIY